MLLRARILLPVTAPPIEDGAVLVSGVRIAVVGRWRDVRALTQEPAVDLGEVVLLPGLVNAHCHLDYTHLAGHLAPPRRFTDWLQGVLVLKAEWSYSEFAASWLAGAAQLLHRGCTCVLDFEAVPELLPEVWQASPLRVISALEMTGVRSARAPHAILDEALACAQTLGDARHRIALAPHAPYSTPPQLLELVATAGATHRLLTAIHVAESADEFAMFREASGPMYDWLRPQRDMADCGKGTPVAHVARSGLLGPTCLVVHANHLEPDDYRTLARSGATVVHCPRSHDYFGRDPFPYAEFRRAGVPVCLGTDSLLSVRKMGRGIPQLDPFAEMALFAARHPDIPPREVLSLMTTVPARAMGLGGELGDLVPGMLADMIAAPFAGGVSEAPAAIIQAGGAVAASLIGGAWAVRSDRVPPGLREDFPSS